MAFELDQKKFLAHLFDRTSGQDVNLYYRRPEPTEEIKFKSAQANLVIKHGKSKDTEILQSELNSLLLEYGDKVLLGFPEGEFTLKGKKISSDEKSSNYYEGWRSVVRERAPFFVKRLCEVAFGEVQILSSEGDERPFLNNSKAITEPVTT